MTKRSDFDLIHQNSSTDSKIVASLERIAQAFRVLLWQQSKDHSLTPIQVQVLIFLHYHGEEKRKISYLATEFNMTKATISDTVKTLQSKKLITKTTEPGDSRSFIIQLTDKGRTIAGRTSLFSEQIRLPVEQLPAEDKESFLRSLLSIISYLNRSGVITIQRMCTTCIHYQKATSENQPYCTLLNQPLTTRDLRIDCPEYQSKV